MHQNLSSCFIVVSAKEEQIFQSEHAHPTKICFWIIALFQNYFSAEVKL
jgi:hypothetical protein